MSVLQFVGIKTSVLSFPLYSKFYKFIEDDFASRIAINKRLLTRNIMLTLKAR